MQTSPPCPVCTFNDWECIGSRTYSTSEMHSLDEYRIHRYRVLFDIWFPKEKEITLKSKLCKSCGFIIYSPRPSNEDISNKYKFLSNLGVNQSDKYVKETRAKELFQNLKNYLKKPEVSLLDFGGGDGSLLSPFVNNGNNCYVVDHYPNQIDGVTLLSRNIGGLSPEMNFDIIVASHVLEHLADPYAILVALRKFLKPSGILYVEVPMEVWRKVPLHDEPVTHINFFTKDSLLFLLQRAGFMTIKCWLGKYFHSYGHKPTAIRVIAKHGSHQIPLPSKNARKNSLRLLKPDLIMFMYMSLIHPEWVWKYIKRLGRKIIHFNRQK